ncbi:alpha/beta hydrolase fold family protein [Purpureocillium lavendulum]|uniref:Alpha/beta hydrolase fold family protein n=1 Tax=Purpureocillium lavendulum TaxID=1247861 RepID=A0AB34FT77_9HYPO|nr:alpha/beta hydrolase fold family protein [Purpureocillium lavendulum]
MSAAREFVDDPRFSRAFELPADPTRGRHSAFRIAYADYGYRKESDAEQETVLLFFGSLMGSRLVHVAKDKLAKEHGIRIINPDRPGIGGTDAVDPERRVAVWLGERERHVRGGFFESETDFHQDAIPALLAHLGIKHVSVGCHSCGVIYALDMLLHRPDLLHPERPYLAIGAPWILPAHTGSTALSVAQSLPASIIGQTDKLARLINNHVGPMVGTSVGLVLRLSARLAPKSQSIGERTADGDMLEDEVWPAIVQRMYAEGVKGIADDAVLLMQKHHDAGGWGDWGDYDVLVPRLAEALCAAGRRLKVDVLYAEDDFIVGGEKSKGQIWFDRCWNVRRRDAGIDYSSMTVKGVDHDGLWDLKSSTVHRVFKELGQQGEPRQN